MTIIRSYPKVKDCIVNLKSGTAFQGLLTERRGEYYVMRQATHLPDGKPVDGEIWVKIGDIDFIQVL